MKFSIVIPAFKATFLKECIESVLSQSYVDFELIILNDASPENIFDIVNEFSDSRIKYFENQTNVGAEKIIHNWNKLLSLAKGEYFMCIGDDDVLLSNCLEEYVKLIDKYPTLDLYHGWTEIIDQDSIVVALQEARPERETVYSMIWHRWNGRNQFIGDFLFNTKSLLEVGGFYYLPLAWASDDLTTFIVAKKYGIANTQVPVFQYRVSTLTISSNGKEELKLDAMKLERNWYTDFFNSSKRLSGTDTIYHKMLIQEIDLYFRRKKVSVLRKYFLKHSFLQSTIYWFNLSKKYDINLKIILKAGLDSIIFRISK